MIRQFGIWAKVAFSILSWLSVQFRVQKLVNAVRHRCLNYSNLLLHSYPLLRSPWVFSMLFLRTRVPKKWEWAKWLFLPILQSVLSAVFQVRKSVVFTLFPLVLAAWIFLFDSRICYPLSLAKLCICRFIAVDCQTKSAETRPYSPHWLLLRQVQK